MGYLPGQTTDAKGCNDDDLSDRTGDALLRAFGLREALHRRRISRRGGRLLRRAHRRAAAAAVLLAKWRARGSW